MSNTACPRHWVYVARRLGYSMHCQCSECCTYHVKSHDETYGMVALRYARGGMAHIHMNSFRVGARPCLARMG